MVDKQAIFNGKPCDRSLAANRGMAYGDGLYETLLVNEGKPLWLDEHLARLLSGATRLRLDIDSVALCEDVRAICAPVKGRRVLKILCFRRSGGRGYQPQSRTAERLLSLWPEPGGELWHHGARLMLCQTRMAMNAQFAGIKHCNRLEQVMAAEELQGSTCDEGLMLDTSGRVIEGTRSNLFAVSSGKLYTPSLNESGVAGIMREKILHWAKAQGIPTLQVNMGPSMLQRADEIFVCNSVFGLWPALSIGCLQKSIGPMSRAAQAHFESQFHA
ncbi:aminodeoxychorismate lyase [Spongiibacter marinus]|uniref:aminodeoxychorismate lyase n=1 Tax=Spongiibacter marinus TaxID=354246 RepID=UPI00195FDD4A|nr:aminodeoxychorismate lyase [Spongiibacter marinus]MBM7423866.1 4-amino-4-deoxychorismate lyase [Spongiibacter marinus]